MKELLRRGATTKMLIQDYLIKSAERFPDKETIIHKTKRTTYGELLSASRAVTSWLINQDLKPGDRVAILMDDPAEYISAYFGILMAGGIVVAMNTQTSARTLMFQLGNCEVSTIFTQMKFIRYFHELSGSLSFMRNIVISELKPGVSEKINFKCFDLGKVLSSYSDKPPPLPEIMSSDIAQIIYTSGTTGNPNGVMLRHSSLVANTDSIVEYLNLSGNDRIMAVLPFFYSYGNSIMLTHIAIGGSLVVNQNFLYPNAIFDEMIKEKVTGFSGVPSTFAILLHRSAIRQYKFPNLRYVTQAGGAMSPKHARELKDIFPDVDIFIMYGQTEASARLSYLDPKDFFQKAGSIGKAIPGVTLEVLDSDGKPAGTGETGEIVARGANIMAGYWGSPEKTAQVIREEKLWTGDLARIDEDGYITIVSRKNDMIKSGSHRISPKEIEEVILEHKAVHEVAVVGVEDAILGESIKAFIVLKEGRKHDNKELLLHCRKLLPIFKVPQSVEFYEELPKTTSGKVKKNELKSLKKNV